jgi:hypothetical protein
MPPNARAVISDKAKAKTRPITTATAGGKPSLAIALSPKFAGTMFAGTMTEKPASVIADANPSRS